MATTARGSSGGREKRGTSPSGPLIKKTPKPSTSTPGSSSSSPTKEKMSSPTDGKPVPNYLKPTMSSNLDFSRLPKKQIPDASSQKPALNRRRSFDRPPPASQVQKAIRNLPAVREIKPFRSSSFSQKAGSTASASASSTRPASERIYARTTSSIKESKVEPVLSKSRSLKKSIMSSSSTPTSKKDSSGPTPGSSKKKAPKSVASESSIDDNLSVADQLAVEDDLVNIDSEVQSLPEISEMPDSNEELGDPTTITEVEVKPVEVVQDNPVEDQKPDVHEEKSVDVEQVVEEAVMQETVTIDHEHEQKVEQTEVTKPESEPAEEKVPDQPEVTVAEQQPEVTVADDQPEVKSEEQDLTVEVAGETQEAEKEAPIVEQTETLAEEKKEETVLEQETEKVSGEAEAKVENLTVSTPPAPSVPSAGDATPAKTQSQSAAGKKDKQAYNDVIEETATKLRGRKNKVLALAGAFETVISLQDNNKN